MSVNAHVPGHLKGNPRNLDRNGLSPQQKQPGFGRFIPAEDMRRLGYRPTRNKPWSGQHWKPIDRLEAFQRIEYEKLMGKPPVLGTPEDFYNFEEGAALA